MLVAAAQASADFVEQAVTASDQDGAGIHTHIGADRSCVPCEFNAAGHGTGAEVIDQDAGAADGGNVELRAVGGGEEVDRLDGAMPVRRAARGRRVGVIADESQGLRDRTSRRRAARCWR